MWLLLNLSHKVFRGSHMVDITKIYKILFLIIYLRIII